jgi:hypothetical protein
MTTPKPRGANGVTYAAAADGHFDKRGGYGAIGVDDLTPDGRTTPQA